MFNHTENTLLKNMWWITWKTTCGQSVLNYTESTLLQNLCWITPKNTVWSICVELHWKHTITESELNHTKTTPFDQSVLNYIENTLLQNLCWTTTPCMISFAELYWKHRVRSICVESHWKHRVWSVYDKSELSAVKSVMIHSQNSVCDTSVHT